MHATSSESTSSRAAFRYPNFRYYMSSRFLTTTSSEMQSVAVGWQIYEITHRPLDLGLVGLAQFLPGILLFLIAGHTADRLPRLRILKACYLGFSTCSLMLLAFALRGPASPYPIYAALLLNGVVRAFQGPASQAFLPLLVPQEHFPNAVAWGASIFQTATIVGPMLGGFVYGFGGHPGLVYACAAIGYFSSFIFISSIEIERQESQSEAASWAMILGGLEYIWRNKLIFSAISLDLFAVLLGGAVALLPVYAREILHVGATGLGLLRSAPGIGAVITAIVVAHWPLKRRAGIAMLLCVFAFGAFTVVFGISRNLALSLTMLVLIGAVDMVSVIIRHTLVQLGTPDEMRGRVSAVNMVFIGASNEVGQFESGITAQWFGTVPAVVLGGVGTIVIVILWNWLFPVLRGVDRLIPEPSIAVSADKSTGLAESA
ncbi:MAG: MFS transporter [Acidobacteriaceae bacterium]|nr:MFS transporter [Acidobacteriaceae bacterium]MBV9779467.1 MFS transporter [Acidobacteriaceae bacterium]